MYAWYVIFANDPTTTVLFARWDAWPGHLPRFRLACRDGALNGRYVLGMWIIHQSPAKVEVVERFGRTPSPLMGDFDVRLTGPKDPA